MSFSLPHALLTLSKHPTPPNTLPLFKSTQKPPSLSRSLSSSAAPDDYYIFDDAALYMIQTFPELKAQARYAYQTQHYAASEYPSKQVTYLKLREASLRFYLRVVLLERQQRVVLYEKQEGSSQFVKTREASPGNVLSFEWILFEDEDSAGDVWDATEASSAFNNGTAAAGSTKSSLVSIIVGVSLRQTSSGEYLVGLASIDILNRIIYITQFSDNLELSHLESVLIQVSAKECIYVKPATDLMQEKLKEIFQRSEICFTQQDEKVKFKQMQFENDLMTLVAEEHRLDTRRVANELTQSISAQEAGNCVINYLDLLSDPDNLGTFRVKAFDVNTFMRLDSSAMKSLNVMTSELGKRLSLYGLLDSCKTRMGSRKLETWVRQPLRYREEIHMRQAVIECFVDDPNMLEALRNDLRYIKDMSTILRRLKSKKCTLKDMYFLYETVKKLPSIIQHLECDAPLSAPENYEVLRVNFLIPLNNVLEALSSYKQMIEEFMDLQLAEEEHEYLLKPEIDDSLRTCHDLKEAAFSNMERIGQQICNAAKIELKIVNIDKNKYRYYCLQTTKKNYDSLKKVKTTELDSKKTGVFFTVKDFEMYAKEFEERRAEYEELQRDMVQSVVGVAHSYANMLDQARELIAEIDVLASLAHVAVANNYVKPQILDASENVLHLVESRHPMVESEKEFIKNDVYIGKEDSRFLVVTGCNMGGKSTYCRQIAIIVLMAQIGSFVPCTEASISIRDAILCRIGANDALLIGISTFMAEMIETSSILHNATSESLVVVDELGRGTSSYDGYALAYAISEYLLNQIGCMTLFATHFHELSQLEEKYGSRITNLHVQTAQSNDNVHMLYKIAPGCSKESFGIEVARLVGFPDEIVKTAEEKVHQIKERKRKREEDLQNVNKRQRVEQIEEFLHRFAALTDASPLAVHALLGQ